MPSDTTTHTSLVLQDCFKTHSHDLDKTRDPAETVRWARERLAQVNLDILTRTQRIDTGRLDIPVFISLCGQDATRLMGTKKQMGKGATSDQSEASALMELIERFSFFSFVKQRNFPLLPYGDLAEAAVPAELLKLSVRDKETPTDLCERFLSDFPMHWVKATNLTRGIDQWVPFDWFYLINEYNGPASGNTMEEAVLQALCEVVERHVGSVVCHDQRATPAIDPASVTDPAAVELLAKFRRQGIRVYLRDFSLDTGIPTVGALAYDPSTFPERSEIVFTAGTTSNPEKSLCRALTEVAQLAGDFESRTSYRPTLPKYPSLQEARYLMDEFGAISIHDLPDLVDPNFRVEIERCVAALARIGLEVLIVDVTHPDIGVPAVYCIVPGAHFLEHTRDTDFPQHAARTLLRSLPPERVLPEMERLLKCFGPRYDLSFFFAHSLELEGKPEAALPVFRRALEQSPDPREIASIYVHIASCLKELERYEEALDSLAEAETFNGELKEIHNLRGFCHFKLKNHQDSIKAFETAIELDPGSAIDYANIGSNLRELGHKKEAIHLYKMALDLDPDLEFARENVRRLEAELGELQEG